MNARTVATIVGALMLAAAPGQLPRGQVWVTAWAGSVHGPYPSGNPVAQPVLDRVFDAQRGATDQTFRLIVRADRVGTAGAAALRQHLRHAAGHARRSLRRPPGGRRRDRRRERISRVTFSGKTAVTLPPGQSAFSDPVALPFVARGVAGRPRRPQARRQLPRRGIDGTDDVARQGAADLVCQRRPAAAATAPRNPMRRCRSRRRPGTSSTPIDVQAPQDTSAVVCFGDSITDGTGSTLNGDDRWPDVLARRLHAAYGSRFAVVNAGIGGNRITGPTPYDPKTPFAGGPSALDRLERDVLSLSGVSTDHLARRHQRPVVGHQRRGGHRRDARKACSASARAAPFESSARPSRPALGATSAAGTPDVDARRKTVNAFIRSSGIFDGVVDFDAATRDADAPAACGRSSNPTAASAAPATRCTPIAPAIWRWATRWI